MKTVTNEVEVDKEFSALVAQTKSCAPEPQFSYRTVNLKTSANFVVNTNNKARAYVSKAWEPGLLPLEIPVIDPLTGDDNGTIRTGFNYSVAIVIIGH